MCIKPPFHAQSVLKGALTNRLLEVYRSHYRRYRSKRAAWFQDQLHRWCKDRWRRTHGCAHSRHSETSRFMMPFGLAARLAKVFNVVFAIRSRDYPSVSDVPSEEVSWGSHAHSSQGPAPTCINEPGDEDTCTRGRCAHFPPSLTRPDHPVSVPASFPFMDGARVIQHGTPVLLISSDADCKGHHARCNIERAASASGAFIQGPHPALRHLSTLGG